MVAKPKPGGREPCRGAWPGQLPTVGLCVGELRPVWAHAAKTTWASAWAFAARATARVLFSSGAVLALSAPLARGRCG